MNKVITELIGELSMKKLIVANLIPIILKANNQTRVLIVNNILNYFHIVETKDWANKARRGG